METSSNSSSDNGNECAWYGETCHRYCTRLTHSEAFGIHCNGRGYCSESGRNCVCDPGYADGSDGICSLLLPVPPVPMDPILKAFLFYGAPAIGFGIVFCHSLVILVCCLCFLMHVCPLLTVFVFDCQSQFCWWRWVFSGWLFCVDDRPRNKKQT